MELQPDLRFITPPFGRGCIQKITWKQPCAAFLPTVAHTDLPGLAGTRPPADLEPLDRVSLFLLDVTVQ